MMCPSRHVDRGEERSSPRAVVIREEYVALTHNPLMAAVLNQLVYWSQRVSNFDRFIEEEQDNAAKGCHSSKHGWFYKTAQELLDETMLRASLATIRRYISNLVHKGWIQTRSNPKNEWDKTTQYRVNLNKLNSDLHKQGYTLPGFGAYTFASVTQNDSTKNKTPQKNSVSREIKDEDFRSEASSAQNVHLDVNKMCTSKLTKGSSRSYKFEGCNTETTTEITNKEHKRRTCEDLKREVFEDAAAVWKRAVGQEVRYTLTRQRNLAKLLSLQFYGDFNKWHVLCERISDSSFLMGKGPRGWKVSLDWVLNEKNLHKVLEGNFDDSDYEEKKQKTAFQKGLSEKREALLESIENPLWREWCTQLLFISQIQRDPILTSELETLRQVGFVEFDGKLVWIECPNVTTQSCVENLRLKLLTVAQKTYPDARNIRTTLYPPKTKKKEKKTYDQ